MLLSNQSTGLRTIWLLKQGQKKKNRHPFKQFYCKPTQAASIREQSITTWGLKQLKRLLLSPLIQPVCLSTSLAYLLQSPAHSSACPAQPRHHLMYYPWCPNSKFPRDTKRFGSTPFALVFLGLGVYSWSNYLSSGMKITCHSLKTSYIPLFRL